MKYANLRTAGFMAAVLTLLGGSLTGIVGRAQAQVMLEEQGTLQPAQAEYAIDVEAGEVVSIVLTSEDFDTVLTLLGPSGEEVASNDDFGGTLNSRIVYNADASGTYTVITKSFDGQGGSYSLEVRPATAYEVSFTEARTSLDEGNYEAAIAAYSEAIAIDPEDPEAYIGRAEAHFGMAFEALESQGLALENPDDLSPETREAIIVDYEQAAELYDASGDDFTAQNLRDQIEYLQTGDTSAPTEGDVPESEAPVEEVEPTP